MIVTTPSTGTGARRVLRAGIISMGASACLAGGAQAQVVSWSASKGFDYVQTAANVQPTVIAGASAYSSIEVTGLPDIGAADFDGAFDFQQDGVLWEAEALFATPGELEAAIPANATYSINITAGTLAPLFQLFTLGPDQYPGDVPYLTGTSFDDLQGADPAQSLTLTWNSAASIGATNSGLFIDRDLPGGGCEVVYDVIFDASVNSVVLPAGTLVPGGQYHLEIAYGNIATPAPDPAGFNAPGMLAYARSTSMSFQAATCDGDANLDGAVNSDDLIFVIFRLGASGVPGLVEGDANGDGSVDSDDLIFVIFRLGTPCG